MGRIGIAAYALSGKPIPLLCVERSHAHLIISAANPQKINLPHIIRYFKKFMAGKIIREIETAPESRQEYLLDKFWFASGKNSCNTTYQFWKQNSHAEERN